MPPNEFGIAENVVCPHCHATVTLVVGCRCPRCGHLEADHEKELRERRWLMNAITSVRVEADSREEVMRQFMEEVLRIRGWLLTYEVKGKMPDEYTEGGDDEPTGN